MKIERTYDPKVIKNILLNSGEKVSDELSVIAPLIHICLVLHNEKEALGLVGMRPINETTYEIHLSLIKEGIGRKAQELARDWMFENTTCEKVVALIPENRKDIINLAKKSGFKYEGQIKNSHREEKMFDIKIYGVEKCLS